jgi:hydroxymethylbilane synthase
MKPTQTLDQHLPQKLTIATRESRLALWQAHHIKNLLEAKGCQVTLLGMTTLGDQILDKTLSKVGGKGLFVKELETALLDGRADLAVHSLKDVPMDLRVMGEQGFALAAVLEREDPRDAFVSNDFARLEDLPVGAVVGTSSLRRMVLLKALRPDLTIEPLRGNLDTRLGKLDAGNYAAIVLAAAGLKRLGLESRIRYAFETTQMLPAAGQGALGLEIRSDRTDLCGLLDTLVHQPTLLAVSAERAVSRAMGGSCSMPLAAHAVWEGAEEDSVLFLRAAFGNEVTGEMRTSEGRQAVRTVAQAEAFGERIAKGLSEDD